MLDSYLTYNAAFRAYRNNTDHPALKGHDLTPSDPITGFDPDYLIPADIISVKEIQENPKPSHS